LEKKKKIDIEIKKNDKIQDKKKKASLKNKDRHKKNIVKNDNLVNNEILKKLDEIKINEDKILVNINILN
jgi:hypothetical protein